MSVRWLPMIMLAAGLAAGTTATLLWWPADTDSQLRTMTTPADSPGASPSRPGQAQEKGSAREAGALIAVPSQTEQDRQLITTLTKRIEQESAARRELEKQVKALGQALEDLQRTLDREPYLAMIEARETAAADEPEKAAEGEPEEEPDSDPEEQERIRFITLGFSPEQAAAMKRRVQEGEMVRLYLRDQAMRENWLNTPEYRQALRELELGPESARAELGDSAYDAVLYATGQANRIVVQTVIGSSPAEQIGIQSGDAIYSYDGQRLFSWRDLRTATAQGESAEPVSIEIERDGQRLQLSIPRGPLGVRLDTASVAP